HDSRFYMELLTCSSASRDLLSNTHAVARVSAECAIAGSREDKRHVSSAALFLDLLVAGGLTHEAIPAVHGDRGDWCPGLDRVGSGEGSGRYQGSARHDFGAEERRSDDA